MAHFLSLFLIKTKPIETLNHQSEYEIFKGNHLPAIYLPSTLNLRVYNYQCPEFLAA